DLVSNPTQVSMFLLSKLTRENNVKVVLTGDGGDELFGGYERYYYYNLIEKWWKLPKSLRKRINNRQLLHLLGKDKVYQKLNLDNEFEVFLSFRSQKDDMVNKFLNPEINNLSLSQEYIRSRCFKMPERTMDLAKRLMKADIDTWLVDESLAQTDRMTMAWGVEQRVPILDYELLELAMRVPTKYKVRSPQKGKWIMKQAMKEYLPDFIFHKEKTAWFSPISHWLRGDLKDMAYEILSPGYNPDFSSFVDPRAVRQMLDDHISKKQYAMSNIWSLMIFQIWLKQFK
ncbi:MAG: asparagine synthase C-terminal domain-containing protein, partial [Patescibacteria group bacterium]